MQLYAILASLLPLAVARCPQMLKGLKGVELSPYIQEAVDAACGSTNFSSIFWTKELIRDVAVHIARGPEYCFNYGTCHVDDTTRAFEPLVVSLIAQFQSIENIEAKNFVDDAIAASGMEQFVMNLPQSAGREENEKDLQTATQSLNSELQHDAKFALAQAMKRAFGMEETTEMRKRKIQNAMEALDRNKKKEQDNPRTLEVMKMILFMITDKISFKNFTVFAENELKGTGISPLEVLPAIETLYVQHRSLLRSDTNQTLKSARDAINLFLIHHIEPYEIHTEEGSALFFTANAYKNDMILLDTIEDEVMTTLIETFPEFFSYLEGTGSFDRNNYKGRYNDIVLPPFG